MGLWTRRNWMTLAAVSGFVAVAVGAFAAHGVSDPKAQEWLRTGSVYGFIHTMATFACATFMQAGASRARHAPAFFLGGVVIFSGSLYAMAGGTPVAGGGDADRRAVVPARLGGTGVGRARS